MAAPIGAAGGDHALGVLETILAVGSVAWLYWVVAARRSIDHRPAIVLCLALAVTIIQPFGIVAKEVPRPSDDALPTATDRNRAGPLGFRVYGRDELMVGELDFKETLRVRSSLFGPFFYNSTQVDEVCKSLGDPPCWDEDETFVGYRELLKRGQTYWFTLSYPDSLEAKEGGHQQSYTWELSFGIASWPGLGYWMLVALLIAYARWGRRSGAFERDSKDETSPG